MGKGFIPVQRALISVSDKSGLAELAAGLVAAGVHLISTGGTALALRAAGHKVQDVAELTGYPEMMDGRVKTLHPAVHGGLLARRDRAEHLEALDQQTIALIDLLIVNLYPFEQTVARQAAAEETIENIDIGGPAMIRAAAKNHDFTAVVTDPQDYAELLAQLAKTGGTDHALRADLAGRAFARTAGYDSAIASWMASRMTSQTGGQTEPDALPDRLTLSARQAAPLRYGENPHQQAASYITDAASPSVLNARQIQGKPLSYNNLHDGDAALALAAEFSGPKSSGPESSGPEYARPAVVIVKHANPCGVAALDSLEASWQAALACDPVSAFGGIVAVNQQLDAATAAAIAEIFTEVIIAPDASEEACAILAKKPNLRLLLTGGMPDASRPGLKLKSVAGGLLAQSVDNGQISADDLQFVTEKKPDANQLADLLFAWKVAKHVKSNAIVYARDGATAAIGAGQMSRLDSSRIAARKAEDMAAHHGWDAPRTVGSAVASDAFFPFPDGLLAAAEAGASSVIQPGGSKNDAAVIEAADAAGLAMVFTGMRHFNH
ncbi:MAG: bifunctional phosphoribosylaminoimidazolecarboxamide formyltransferase/IMP cyclohydrolase [Alphaproteobacteria bacterium]|jgi:phosphoribosylaminoimidazolecarboxamide formyltransferase/IMP cyclohydrolase|nr:bifunctional phosphoribosylaminoimidazolecarboxamide formyltransferase/IMP cyclohydrolase [Alphaproteobacteria bacterium]